jgi:molecular chaperone DnaK
MAADNKSLGKFVLDGIPPAPRGVPQIEVAFDLDADGILNVTAQDKATNRSQHITIQGSSGLSEEEIESMVSAAEEYRDEDRQRKERIEVRNAGDAAIYAAERAMKDLGEKTDPAMKAGMDETLETLRKALAGEDLESIRNATSALQQEVQRVGTAAYQQQDEAADEDAAEASQPESEAVAGEQEQSPDEEVVEGEFTEE